MKVLNGDIMTKKKLVKLLEDIPDNYEVLVDINKLRTVFTDHKNQRVNLSSDAVFQYACNYNPLTILFDKVMEQYYATR